VPQNDKISYERQEIGQKKKFVQENGGKTFRKKGGTWRGLLGGKKSRNGLRKIGESSRHLLGYPTTIQMGRKNLGTAIEVEAGAKL